MIALKVKVEILLCERFLSLNRIGNICEGVTVKPLCVRRRDRVCLPGRRDRVRCRRDLWLDGVSLRDGVSCRDRSASVRDARAQVSNLRRFWTVQARVRAAG